MFSLVALCFQLIYVHSFGVQAHQRRRLSIGAELPHKLRGGPVNNLNRIKYSSVRRRRNGIARSINPNSVEDAADVLIIGSGIGGLSCGAMLARYGYNVTILESHAVPGGAAHGFSRKGFKFDTGPSLYAGMSKPSVNPLRQVLDAVDEKVSWHTYSGWSMHMPQGSFKFKVGPDEFPKMLREFGGQEAVEEWSNLLKKIGPLHESSSSLPPLAMRSDLNVLRTIWRYLPALLKPGPATAQVAGPLSSMVDGLVQNKFLYHWLDFLAFALCGLPADGTVAAAVIYMLGEMHKEGAVLDAPIGGGVAIVNALVRGLEKNGGTLLTNKHVSEILIENGRAVGVKLKNNRTMKASKAVVSNAPLWNTADLLRGQTETSEGARKFVALADGIEPTPSFMHLHLGIRADGLPKTLEPHEVVINDWENSIDAPQNLVVISIPSLLDPSLAPEGHHVVHAYLAGNEPYEVWEAVKTRDAYEDLREQRSKALWTALERVVPDIRSRVVDGVNMTATPVTHARYLRRFKGAYGPNIPAGKKSYPGTKTEVEGLFRCGDSCFPGVGVPAVAASGINAANSIVSVDEHLELLDELRSGDIYDASLTKPSTST